MKSKRKTNTKPADKEKNFTAKFKATDLIEPVGIDKVLHVYVIGDRIQIKFLESQFNHNEVLGILDRAKRQVQAAIQEKAIKQVKKEAEEQKNWTAHIERIVKETKKVSQTKK